MGRSVESIGYRDCFCVAVDSVKNKVSSLEKAFPEFLDVTSAVENRSCIFECKVECLEKIELFFAVKPAVKRHEELRENRICLFNADFRAADSDVSRAVQSVDFVAVLCRCVGVEPCADELIGIENRGNVAEVRPF